MSPLSFLRFKLIVYKIFTEFLSTFAFVRCVLKRRNVKEVPVMKTSSYSIFDFLEHCGGNWRNTVYVPCGCCFHPCRAKCRGCLLTADMDGRPMAISVTRFEAITGQRVDLSECVGTLSRYAFDELFRHYRIWGCDDLGTCLLCHLDSNISAAPCLKQDQAASPYGTPSKGSADDMSSTPFEMPPRPNSRHYRPKQPPEPD